MAAQDLLSAKYLTHVDDAVSTSIAGDPREPSPAHGSSSAGLARLTAWISVVAAVAVVACAVALVVPLVKTAAAKKANGPVDWIVQMTTGKRSDEIVGKWIRDRSAENQRYLDEQFKNSQPFDTSKPVEWNFDPQKNAS